MIDVKWRINLTTIHTFVPKKLKDLKEKKIKRRGTEIKVQYIMNLTWRTKLKRIQPAVLNKFRDLIENRKIQRRTDMQTAYISIWMKGCNWKNSKLLLQKSNKSQGTEIHLHKTGGLKLNPALRREKRGHKRSTDYMSLHVDLVRARATSWDSGKGYESF